MKIFVVLFIVMLIINMLMFISTAVLCFYLGLCLREKDVREIKEAKEKIKAVLPDEKTKPPDNKEVQAINETLKMINEYDGKPPVVRRHR